MNPKARGMLPVAILGSAALDVALIDVDSIRFGKEGTEVAPVNYNRYDLNADTLPDLVLEFPNQETRLVAGTTSAKLTGRLTNDTPFEGSDSVRIVGN